jgi:serine phosphatase RsbU (regulator of sigma subunit)
MISANILGMFSSYGLEYYSRVAFWREEQLIKIRNELETESLRKTKELEDARQIQLAMLPPCVDNIFDLNTCFEMRTAAEVGGDYYDYKISDDGSLTLVLGDATGHGMKAGILVAVIKSLFTNFKSDMDFNTFLNHSSNTIKSMRLGSLYMSLLLLKYKEGEICFTAAGMPPLFIYRSAKKEIEKLTVKGMPLGAFESFNYTEAKTKLYPGDTAFLMTDGYPELFNSQNETLDYKRVSEILCSVDKSSAAGIINQLFAEGDKWRGDKPQQDDITFIVFKREE